jgi:hypothetical protein
MNSIQTNKKNDINETHNANFFEGSLYTEIGDKALCKIIETDYNDFNKLDLQSKYELSKNHLQETLDFLINEYRKGYGLDNYKELEELLTTYSYNYKFTPEHLKNCDCYKAVTNRFMDLDYYKNKINELESKGKGYKIDLSNPADKFAYNNKYENIKNEIYIKASEALNKYYFDKNKISLCPYLFRELINTLNIFKKDYDLSKTKVREVVKSIINYQISLYNSNVYSANNGMFENVSDKFGNVSNKISSNEYYKMKLNEQIIKAIKTLDEMIEGNKNINVDLSVKSISIKDVLKRIDV